MAAPTVQRREALASHRPRPKTDPWQQLTDAQREAILERRKEHERMQLEVLKVPKDLIGLNNLFRFAPGRGVHSTDGDE